MDKHRRVFTFGLSAFATAAALPWSQLYACTVESRTEFLSRSMLPKWILHADANAYRTAYYGHTAHLLAAKSSFWIKTPPLSENHLIVPVRLYLPRNLGLVDVNGLIYEPNSLVCTGVEVVSESMDLYPPSNREKDTSMGTYHICSFGFTSEVTEVSLRYRRFEKSRLVAFASMARKYGGETVALLVAESEILDRGYCRSDAFVSP